MYNPSKRILAGMLILCSHTLMGCLNPNPDTEENLPATEENLVDIKATLELLTKDFNTGEMWVVTPALLEVFIKLLSHKNDDVRKHAAKAFGRMGKLAATKESIAALKKNLSDKNKDVRENAAQALDKMGEYATTPAVVEAPH